jgi:hypothetical protein
MLVVAGLSLKNLKPKVWDPDSQYFLPSLQAVMVSYADFHAMPARRKTAMDQGLHGYLGIPPNIKIYLDNGAFYFLGRGSITPTYEYEEFVQNAQPDWYPIPQEFIPTPSMSLDHQLSCFNRTMTVNRSFGHDDFVPVIHISQLLPKYIKEVSSHERLAAKPAIALGGIVPNLLRAPKAIPYEHILENLWKVRVAFASKQLHVFGIGGTATLHLAALVGFDSLDSSGWRNRAARGIIQLPGRGDRMLADLGNWRGRRPRKDEMDLLEQCVCPACHYHGIDGLKAPGITGFSNRATHNLWILLEEANWIIKRLGTGAYESEFKQRLDNTIYLPLIEQVFSERLNRIRKSG